MKHIEPHIHKRLIILEPYDYESALKFFKKHMDSKSVKSELHKVSDYGAFNVIQATPSKALVITHTSARYSRKRITKFSEKVDNVWERYLSTLDADVRAYYNYATIDYPKRFQEVLDLLPKDTIL